MRTHIFILFLIQSLALSAQDLSQDAKHWYQAGINLRLSKTNTLSFRHLSSFDVNGYRHGFMQQKLNFTHRLGKSWSANAGYTFSVINGSNGQQTPYHRVHLGAAHRVQFFRRLRMQNSIQLEKFFPQLQKFGARAVVSNKWQYYNKKWPLRLSPYVKNQVFYYQGGKEVTYWLDEDELEVGEENFIRQAPNGWHRYRFTAGVRARLARHLYLSIFYTLQREFNTGLAPYRELNVPNRSGTKIKRRFNNYSLLGISLVYTLKLY